MIRPVMPAKRTSNAARQHARAIAFERYSDLLTRQIEALEHEDLAEVQRLGMDRDAVARYIDSLGEDAGGDATDDSPARDMDMDMDEDAGKADLDGIAGPAEVGARLGEALRRCADGDARLQRLLQDMRKASLLAARDLERGAGAARAYVGRRAPGGSVDLGF